jgi:hypothetical protein
MDFVVEVPSLLLCIFQRDLGFLKTALSSSRDQCQEGSLERKHGEAPASILPHHCSTDS